MKERIIALLGNGVSAAIAASACGCSESYVSQLMSNEEVAARVSQLRFDNLQAANLRDKRADSIEDKLLQKLEDSIPLMMRPVEILRSYAVVNAAKRRGSSAPEQAITANQVINLHMPRHATVSFTLSAQREIIEVEGTPLVTMQSSQLLKELKEKETMRKVLELTERKEESEVQDVIPEIQSNLSGSGELVSRTADKQAA